MKGINENIVKIRKAVGPEAKIILVLNDIASKDKGLHVNVEEYTNENNISLLIEDIDKVTNQEENFNKYIDQVLNVKSRKNQEYVKGVSINIMVLFVNTRVYVSHNFIGYL